MVLTRRVLPIDEYARELRKGVAKLTRDQCVARYGSPVTPIPVPLAAGETEQEYEASFLKWLAKHNQSLDAMSMNQERANRVLFAISRTKGKGDPKGSATVNKTTVVDSGDQDGEDDQDDPNDSNDYHTLDHLPREEMYVTQLVDLEQYQNEMKSGLLAALQRMPVAEKRKRFGSAVVPIYVPLAPGETPEQYEDRLVSWLQSKHGVTLEELHTHKTRTLERLYRMQFARLNGLGREIFVASGRESKRELTVDKNCAESPESPTKKHKQSVDPEPPLQTLSRSQAAVMPLAPATAQDTDVCLNQEPTQNTVPCGCQRCLVQKVGQLTERVVALGIKINRDHRKPKSVDLKMTTDSGKDGVVRAVECTAGGGHAVVDARALAITDVVLSKPTTLELHQQIDSRLSTSTRDSVQLTDDPIESKLLSDYDTINNELVKLETLEKSAAGFASLNEKRTRALAQLIVYQWRHAQQDLELLMQQETLTNDLPAQRISHQKCAQLSMAMREKQATRAKMTSELNAILERDYKLTPQKLAILTNLGATLTAVEREIHELQLQRKREVVQLIQCDLQLRVGIQAQVAAE